MDNIRYNTVLRLGGAAAAGFIYLALMRILEEMGKDPREIFFPSDSIGTPFATALAIGMSYKEAKSKVEAHPELINRVLIPTHQERIDARKGKREGIKDPSKLERIAEMLFGDITVGEIPNINIIVTDITDAKGIDDYEHRKVIEVNYKTFPKLPVKKAIAASETLLHTFYPYRLNYSGKDMRWIDGGQSYQNLMNIIVPPGYPGRVISIDPLYHFKKTRFASLLQSLGFLERNGHEPEALREGLKVIEILPKISPRRFIDTSPGNIEYLDNLGYTELDEIRKYLSH